MSVAMEKMITAGLTKSMFGLGLPIPRVSSRAAQPQLARVAWSFGDCSVVDHRLQIVAERLAAALELGAGQRVLDIGAGNGNIALPAGRRRCQVVSVVPSATSAHLGAWVERSREAAAAERLAVDFETGDAEALPFADGYFDTVSSSFCATFVPEHERAAAEMLRVCRQNGRIGLASWTQDGFIGQLFETIERHVPLPDSSMSPFHWAAQEYLTELFGQEAGAIDIAPRTFVLRYTSAQQWLDIWRSTFGPLRRALGDIDARAREQLLVDLIALIDRCNVATDGTVALRADYVEVVIRKRGPNANQ